MKYQQLINSLNWELKLEEIVPTINQILTTNRRQLNQLLNQPSPFTWNNLMQPLEELQDRLHKFWAKVEHLHSVMDNEQIRKIYGDCLPKITKYFTEINHNRKLYAAINSITKCDSSDSKINAIQKRIIAHELRDFKLAGIELTNKSKKRFAQIQRRLVQLSTKFNQNLLDATYGWQKLIIKRHELEGLPKHISDQAHHKYVQSILSCDQAQMKSQLKKQKLHAKQQKIKGWLFTLDYPTYSGVMTYAKSRKLREEFYIAYVTRASNQGPNAGKWDNTKIMNQIMQLRQELAKLLNYTSFAEYSLVPKNAQKPQKVLTFLEKLATKVKPRAKAELAELAEYAKNIDGITELKAWDMMYYRERLRLAKYAISEEELRPYLPLTKILDGLFKLTTKLFDLEIHELNEIKTWHPDVRIFAVRQKNRPIAYFYLDLYARAGKQTGAWMHDAQSRRHIPEDAWQLPIAYIVCNFMPPSSNSPSLLTFQDVLTLFHEFGHALQHMLTKVDYLNAAGINGIPWDTIEVASQFMEHWCWEKPFLNLLTQHYQTKRKLPTKMYQRLVAAKNFQVAVQILQQLELSLFDLRLHLDFKIQTKKADQIQTILDKVRKDLDVFDYPAFHRFQNSFAHIFAGSYAAGYYSYKWAEVWACDAFSKFLEDGLFNKATSIKFCQTILESGGAIDPLILFKKFRGRTPQIDAWLKWFEL